MHQDLLDRRRFVRLAAAGLAMGGVALLQACAPAASAPPTAAPANPAPANPTAAPAKPTSPGCRRRTNGCAGCRGGSDHRARREAARSTERHAHRPTATRFPVAGISRIWHRPKTWKA